VTEEHYPKEKRKALKVKIKKNKKAEYVWG
jgi:hypothetical protein